MGQQNMLNPIFGISAKFRRVGYQYVDAKALANFLTSLEIIQKNQKARIDVGYTPNQYMYSIQNKKDLIDSHNHCILYSKNLHS